MTSLPGAGLAVRFPPSIVGRLAGVDHRHHGHGRGGGPGAVKSTMTSLPGAGLAVSFPPSIIRRLAGVDHRHHGHGRGVNDDQLARCRSTRRHVRAVGILHTGRRRSSAPRARRHVRTVGTAGTVAR